MATRSRCSYSKAKKLYVTERLQCTKLLTKVLGKIEGVDYATYDDNMRKFFDGKVDDYVKIKNNIDSGLINPQEGARSLAYISNMIDEYKNFSTKSFSSS